MRKAGVRTGRLGPLLVLALLFAGPVQAQVWDAEPLFRRIERQGRSGHPDSALQTALTGERRALALANDSLAAYFAYFAGASYFALNQSDNGLAALRRAEKRAIRAQKPVWVVRILTKRMEQWAIAGHRDSAVATMRRLAPLLTNLPDARRQANAYVAFARLWLDENRYREALEAYQRALAVYRQLADTINQANTLHNMGSVLAEAARPREALDYYRQARRLWQQAGLADRLGEADGSLARVFETLGAFDSAATYLRRAIPRLEADEQLDFLSAAYALEGRLRRRQGDRAGARTAYDRAITLARAQDLRHELMENLLYAAELDQESGQTTGARGRLAEAAELARAIGDKAARADVLQRLARLTAGAGDYVTAFRLADERGRLLDSLRDENQRRAFAEADRKFQAAQKQQRIELLERDRRIQTLRLAAASRTRWLLIGGLLAAVSVVALVWREARNRQRANEALAVLNARLAQANQTKTMLFGILSHDLRGPVGRVVQFLRLQQELPALLDEAQRAAQHQRLTEAAQQLLDTLEDLLLWAKSNLERFQPQPERVLVAAFLEEVRQLFAATAAEKEITLVVEAPAALTWSLDRNFGLAILRNLVANAVRHTPSGGRVVLGAVVQPGLRLTVTDTGPGLSAAAQQSLSADELTSDRSGLGLRLVRELTTQLGGRFWLEPGPHGVGTTAGVELP